jgi:deoxyribonuclease IV
MTTKKHRLLLGAHMSIAGGLEKSITRGESIHCSTIQIFTKSNRQWHAKPLLESEIDLFKKTWEASSIGPIIAHATYLINIASPDTKTAKASMNALVKELITCHKLGISHLVLHPGAYISGTPQDGLARIINNLNHALEEAGGTTSIALETMAGQGSSLCAAFDDIATILDGITHKKRIGTCFDTCHAFVAGYDLRTEKVYEKTWHQFDTIIGLKKLHAIHVNDSKKGLGSNLDRHEHIGKGALGLEAFRLLFNDERFFDIPKILETPKATKEPFTEDKANMATICSLLSNKTKKILNIEEEIKSEVSNR